MAKSLFLTNIFYHNARNKNCVQLFDNVFLHIVEFWFKLRTFPMTCRKFAFFMRILLAKFFIAKKISAEASLRTNKSRWLSTKNEKIGSNFV